MVWSFNGNMIGDFGAGGTAGSFQESGPLGTVLFQQCI